MTTRKYKDLVEQRTRQTLEEWSKQPSVEEKDIHRFLHNLKGTAGTVGLKEIEELAEQTLPLFGDDSRREWPPAEWGRYLYPLLTLLNDNAVSIMNPSGLPDGNKTEDARPQYEILIIDDDVQLVAYLKESLEKNPYYVSIALSAERGLKIFYESKPDMILLDIMLPDQSGIEVLNQIIGKAKKERIPIIMISAEHSKEVQMHAYSLGVMDFIKKPVDIDIFLTLIQNRFELKREWQESIIVDELTGAFNRKHFNQTMKQLLSDYRRTNRVFSLVLIDLDHFKAINDTYGHLAGDEVLHTFSEFVQASIRVEDVFCRYGGEEFALFLPNTDASSAKLVVERIQRRFSAKEFRTKKHTFNVTFSSGITEVKAGEEQHSVKLVEEADKALYASKHGGRNQTTIYTQQLLATKFDSVLNVIIVDDDALVRRIVTSEFADWKPSNMAKVNISSYSSGPEFLQSDWYSSEEKYIVLLDGIMPVLDGIEVLERIRGNYPEENIVVIMLTGRNNQADIVHALQMGADDYVIKPFDMNELMLRIERLAFRFLF
ncbi:diguanylate cyclase [Paenibacillus sp. NPDC056722]|uniref:diguanylate cyclase n=1 Tax=Paenibacillus sp. NPDC056722 TaxID=3345924 RepID=UPI00367D68E6